MSDKHGDSQAAIIATLRAALADEQGDTISKIPRYKIVGERFGTAVGLGYTKVLTTKGWCAVNLKKSHTFCYQCKKVYDQRAMIEPALERFRSRNDGWFPANSNGPLFILDLIKEYQLWKAGQDTKPATPKAKKPTAKVLMEKIQEWEKRWERVRPEHFSLAGVAGAYATIWTEIDAEIEREKAAATEPPITPLSFTPKSGGTAEWQAAAPPANDAAAPPVWATAHFIEEAAVMVLASESDPFKVRRLEQIAQGLVDPLPGDPGYGLPVGDPEAAEAVWNAYLAAAAADEDADADAVAEDAAADAAMEADGWTIDGPPLPHDPPEPDDDEPPPKGTRSGRPAKTAACTGSASDGAVKSALPDADTQAEAPNSRTVVLYGMRKVSPGPGVEGDVQRFRAFNATDAVVWQVEIRNGPGMSSKTFRKVATALAYGRKNAGDKLRFFKSSSDGVRHRYFSAEEVAALFPPKPRDPLVVQLEATGTIQRRQPKAPMRTILGAVLGEAKAAAISAKTPGTGTRRTPAKASADTIPQGHRIVRRIGTAKRAKGRNHDG